MFELGCIGQEESIEQRTLAERDSALEIGLFERDFEFGYIDLDQVGIEPQLVTAGHERVLAERGPNYVGRDFEQVATPFRVALRPQVGDQLVASKPAAGRQRKQSEQGEFVPLASSAGDYCAIPFECWNAEELELKHSAMGSFQRSPLRYPIRDPRSTPAVNASLLARHRRVTAQPQSIPALSLRSRRRQRIALSVHDKNSNGGHNV